MAHVSLFQVVNSVKLIGVGLVKILGCESLAPAGEMKVRRMEGIVPGENTTLLSCRLQLQRTTRTAKPRRKKFLGQNRRQSAAEIITIVS